MNAKRRDDETGEDAASQSTPPPAGTKAADTKSTSTGSSAAVSKAYLDWQHAVSSAWLAYRTKAAALNLDLSHAVNNEQASASKPLQDARSELQNAMGSALQNQERYQKAWQGFNAASVEFTTNTSRTLQNSVSQIRDTFTQKHQDVFSELQQACRDAHEKYLDALKAIWQGIPGSDVDAATLQSIAWATTQAACWQPPKL